jgi:hypothetical protein
MSRRLRRTMPPTQPLQSTEVNVASSAPFPPAPGWHTLQAATSHRRQATIPAPGAFDSTATSHQPATPTHRTTAHYRRDGGVVSATEDQCGDSQHDHGQHHQGHPHRCGRPEEPLALSRFALAQGEDERNDDGDDGESEEQGHCARLRAGALRPLPLIAGLGARFHSSPPPIRCPKAPISRRRCRRGTRSLRVHPTRPCRPPAAQSTRRLGP